MDSPAICIFEDIVSSRKCLALTIIVRMTGFVKRKMRKSQESVASRQSPVVSHHRTKGFYRRVRKERGEKGYRSSVISAGSMSGASVHGEDEEGREGGG